MSRSELADWQWRKLRAALERARAGSAFWRDRLPERIDSMAEYVERVPLLYRSDLVAAQQVAPPYGTLPSTDPALAVAHHQTSGTSGNPPVRSFDTARDWAWVVDMYCTALYGLGVRPHHRSMVAFGYGLFVGFWGMHYALERIGATVVPGGGMDSQARVRLLVDQRIQVLGCTPSYALRLLETAREMGVDLAAEGCVEIVVAGAEPRAEATTEAIARGFGARVFNIAGTTELGTVNMFECPTAPGHCHIIESGVIEEVLHPQTKQPVDYGELGVRVCTGIGREGMQLFRHWTEDLVIKRPWHECGCGRTWDWFEGGIIGRADDMRKVRGILVTPVMIEDVMRGFPEVAEFRTVLRTIRGLDTIFLQIEPRTGGAADSGDLGDRISAAVKSEIGLRPEVEIVEPGALPRFDLKAVRFHDEREG